MSEQAAFGARYAEASLVERMDMDAERRSDFAAVDEALDRLITAALCGERIARLSPADRDQVELLVSLKPDQLKGIKQHFDVAAQEKRGSWHVPSDEKLSLGLMHMVYWLRRNPRLVLNMAMVDGATPVFADAPEAVALWVLEPLFEQLYIPLKLRSGSWIGAKTAEQVAKQWSGADPLYEALGIDLALLEPFRPGTGWADKSEEEIIAIRQALIEGWSRVPDAVGARYRSYRLGQLVERYYSKAKNGQATRKQVLTGPLGRTLTAFFGGDWLAFLAYLDEQPHPNEQVIQALPKTRIITGTSERAVEVAAEAGVSPEQVKEMLAAYWQQSVPSSPVEQRVQTIRRYWTEFDHLQARQESGMPSLIGLSGSVGPYVLAMNETNEGPTHEGELDPDQVLPADLMADINRLWGTAVLPRFPDRLVSQYSPLAQLVQAIGPAMGFWDGAALTAWYMCEGAYSRTTLRELSDYHSRELAELRAVGCPVSRETLNAFREAQNLLGPEEVVESDELASESGFTVTVSYGVTKRKGFEQVRDIVTEYRRAWTEQYWDDYVRARWEHDLRGVGDQYHRESAKRGKAPTVKQFAKIAAPAANAWFGGNLSQVYAAIGVTSPISQVEELLMPHDRRVFAQRVFTLLGGEPRSAKPEDAEIEWERKWGDYVGLANDALVYVQNWEALGHPPELKKMPNPGRFKRTCGVLADDADAAWSLFSEVVQRAAHEARISR